MVNLKDVAKLAGVSLGTASQAINGKNVSEGTRKKVLECAKKLHYVPNRGGQSLITGKSNNIHLVIFNSEKHPDFVAESSFFYSYIMGILTASQKKGYNFSMEVKSYDDPDLDEYFRVKCSDKSADGIIVVPQYIQNYSFLTHLTSIPHAMLNPCVSDSRLNSVVVDHEYGGRIVAELLLERGYENIGVIHGPEDHSDSMNRRKGFMDYINSHGLLIPDSVQFVSNFTCLDGYEGTKTILNSNNRIQAIFCCNDFVAAGAIRYLQQMDIKIPDDVAIIGYDNVDVSRTVYPEITTVNGMLLEVGRQLVDTVFRQIDNGESGITSTVIPELILRETL